MTVFTTIPSPVGELIVAGEVRGHGVALSSLSIAGGGKAVVPQPEWIRDDIAFAPVVDQLNGYFAGECTRFELEYAVRGTEFRSRVWAALDEIPYGDTVTYGEITARIGASRAAVRAVGSAIGANPLLIVRPCHRVVGADGGLTGYAGGIDLKRRLLELEQAD
ncbi:MAG: methylated-DNA--[protein]-cysteine S-methyltransferase [Nocardia sp.]|nr:methylated-DNA--[protein]-cysteine S-methyltransferase [Nocardia sp.]